MGVYAQAVLGYQNQLFLTVNARMTGPLLYQLTTTASFTLAQALRGWLLVHLT
jgi:hypothetical protein